MTGAVVDKSQIQTLIEKARKGDRDAFGMLVRKYETRLRSAVEHLKGHGSGKIEIDEVVQETFVLAFEAIGRFEWQGEGAFFSWLSRIAKNVLIDHIKDSQHHPDLELPDRLPASGVSPSKVMRREERFERLEKAINDLPHDYREVLRLSRLEGFKVKEIARRLGRSEYAVKHLMARAVRKLREVLGETESLHLPDRPLDLEGGDRGES